MVLFIRSTSPLDQVLDAVIAQDGVDLVAHGGNQGDQESRGGRPAGLVTSWTKANLLVRSIAT
jgi:hypothetical protein